MYILDSFDDLYYLVKPLLLHRKDFYDFTVMYTLVYYMVLKFQNPLISQLQTKF